MKIAIGSGKGGTGKTTVSLGFALTLAEHFKNVSYVDCDVEEPNAHIFLQADDYVKTEVNVNVPEVDESKCTHCKKCSEFCAFNALAVLPSKTLVFKELCHSCLGCEIICPENAISMVPRPIGYTYSANIQNLNFVYGALNIGEAQAVPLISFVKDSTPDDSITIIDAPPGTACPFVETVKNVDYVIIVTEPTPFGLYDMKLTIEVLNTLRLPFGVVINKANIGDGKTEAFCKENEIAILMEIPHEKKIATAYSNGVSIIEAVPNLKKDFLKIFEDINERISNN